MLPHCIGVKHARLAPVVRESLPPITRDPRIARLPKVARRVAAEGAGYEQALELMKRFGGRQIAIPRKPRMGTRPSNIARVLGGDTAAVLCRLYGGETIDIPSYARERPRPSLPPGALRQAICEHPGSHNEAARDLGVTRRYVRMVRGS